MLADPSDVTPVTCVHHKLEKLYKPETTYYPEREKLNIIQISERERNQSRKHAFQIVTAPILSGGRKRLLFT